MNSDEYISSLITSCGPITLCHSCAPPVMPDPPAMWNPSSDVRESTTTWARNLVPPVGPIFHVGPICTHLQISGTHEPHGSAILCHPLAPPVMLDPPAMWHPSSDPPATWHPKTLIKLNGAKTTVARNRTWDVATNTTFLNH